jgi:acetoin utilization protein AcuC
MEERISMKTALVYGPEIRKYDFGEGHPFRGDRFDNFMKFFQERFAEYQNQFERIEPAPATDEQLSLVHDEEYIEAMGAAGEGLKLPDILRYATMDNLNPLTMSIPAGIDEAARNVAGASLLAGELVYESRFEKAIAIGGGLHHAKRSKGEGFCIFNDVAICGRNLLEKGATRIMILDTDAHAGNGTSQIFYADRRVLFVDIHQDPATIYPGTGFVTQIGDGEGRGFNVNIPLPPGSGLDAYKYAFDTVVLPLAQEFQPQIIIRNGGSDPHYFDGLTNLDLTLDGFKVIGKYVKEIAADFCGGKSVDLIASGYNQAVLPYAWSALICGLLDLEVDLSDFIEEKSPAEDARYDDTIKVVAELKHQLKTYWRCMQ